jgi:hypothetical protein
MISKLTMHTQIADPNYSLVPNHYTARVRTTSYAYPANLPVKRVNKGSL